MPGDPNATVIRTGTCVARANFWVPWLRGVAGQRFRFEECQYPGSRFTYFRVYGDGEEYGVTGRFVEFFEEAP